MKEYSTPKFWCSSSRTAAVRKHPGGDGVFECVFSNALIIFKSPCRITRQEDIKAINLSLYLACLDVVQYERCWIKIDDLFCMGKI